jgi:putative OmpL-like beta-barrel porin-2
MKTAKNLMLGATMLVGIAAASGTAMADPLATPSMAGPLSANPNPFSIDLPDWLGPAGGSKLYIGGVVSGLAYGQSNATHAAFGDADSLIDLSNAQLYVEKTDGWFQFYAQFGTYSFPTVGVPYTKSSITPVLTFGDVPVAYVKLQGQDALGDFSIQGGKLPTLIGNEYVFTFENMNIQRGLLWNIEPAVSTGVQGNYSHGPLTISVSWNDGTYAKTWNWLSGLVSYAFTSADTLAFSGGGNLGGGNFSPLNSGDVYTLAYTHTEGAWVISPYVQYNETPKLGFLKGSSVFGGAVLASYSFDDNWKLAGRVEYVSESGTPGTSPDILGYGAGSNAWTVTVTPTFQWKQLFARVDLSYVGLGSATTGFGSAFNKSDQFRGVFETGVIF